MTRGNRGETPSGEPASRVSQPAVSWNDPTSAAATLGYGI
jgi:hypothetical protein